MADATQPPEHTEPEPLGLISVFQRPVWTDEQMGLVLGMKPQTIANRVSRGKPMPPYTHIGGSRRWMRDSVMAWLRDNEVPATY